MSPASRLRVMLFVTLAFIFVFVTADDYTCSPTKPCAIGCCSNGGVCGFGPVFCSAGNCTSSCNAKSECDPGWGIQWSNASVCPLKVCCSKYGFCGTTSDFCGSTTVPQPSCGGSSATTGRIIGYYEGWNLERPCQTVAPEDIQLGYWTHINFAFAYIDPNTFGIAQMASDVAGLYSRVTALKSKQPGLQVWISIGGWAFNDPGSTASTFSNLAASTSAQNAFIASLVSFMQLYNFDGVDLDWEYPVASERAGIPADYVNLVSFMKNLRAGLNRSGRQYGLSITLPSSYWYMRNFDIVSLVSIVDWFNLMTYDLHGTWDATDRYIGSVALAHTNLTEIDLSLQLLWRNNIDPSKVTLGLGFYGRSFTMSSSSCLSAGCPFSSGGNPGPCTGTAGILSDNEIATVIANGATVTLDKAAAVQIVTWNSNQWVSYDDPTTMTMKLNFANSKCLGGTMVWALDLDNGTMMGNWGKTALMKKSLAQGNFGGVSFN